MNRVLIVVIISISLACIGTFAMVVDRLETSRKKTVEEVELLRRAKDKLAYKTGTLEKGMTQKERQVSLLEETRAKLERQNKELSTEIASLREIKEKLEEENRRVQEELIATREKANTIKSETEKIIQKFEEKVRDVKAKIDEKEEELTAKREELARAQTKIEELTERVDREEKYRKELQENIKELKGMIDSLTKQEELKVLGESINNVKSKLEEVDKINKHISAMKSNYAQKKYEDTISEAQEVLHIDPDNQLAQKYIKSAEAQITKAERLEDKKKEIEKDKKKRAIIGQLILWPLDLIKLALP